MRILTFCLAAAVTVLLCVAAHGGETAEEHYKRGLQYGEEAQHAGLFSRFAMAKKTRVEFERAVQLDPDFIEARMALVEYYTRAPHFLGGGEQKAIEQADEILRRDPAEGHRAFAEIYEHQQKHKQAARELHLAEALDHERLSAKRSQ